MALRVLWFVLVVVILFCRSPEAGAARSEARVDRVLIEKGKHALTLLSDDRVVARYHAAIGPGGKGPKKREGDRVTPVGRYHVTARHPSRFKTFLHLDYPNAEDRARFELLRRRGQLPKEATIGGDIGIHGPPVALPPEEKKEINEVDWTLGCIAVDEADVIEIARRVPDGVIVDIED